ncbi:hypothetical protein C9374_003737 [Naegleria lovaniensis]|uniref:Tim44-like domain-containing protein n=1 Tax=Naegleria lovaniensis TaxID=51637 RepID=A0AA88H3R1_NAELO|nr:uncharacterized protein C9374_003737 [Naegleria lovaniensis]KAG2393973.1 hypothetical protein C9374_003737 [Naegleria lovaniensis]
MNRASSSLYSFLSHHLPRVVKASSARTKKHQFIFFFPFRNSSSSSFHTSNNKCREGPKGMTDLFKEHLKRQIQSNESVQAAIRSYQETFLAKGVEKLKPTLSKSKEALAKGSTSLDETTEKILQSETMSRVGKAVDSAYDLLNQKVGLKYITGESAGNRISDLKRAPVFFFRTKYARELDLSKGYVYNPFTRTLVNITDIISQEELEAVIKEIKEKPDLGKMGEQSEEDLHHEAERQEQEREELVKMLTARMQEQRVQEAEAGKPKVNPTSAEELKLTKENSPVISELIEPYYTTRGLIWKTQVLLQEIQHKQTGKQPSLLFRIPGMVDILNESLRFITARITPPQKVKKAEQEPPAEEELSKSSEQALAISELKKRDPRFALDLFLVTIEAIVIPEVLSAYFADDTHTIKKFVSESCYRQIFFPRIQERVHAKNKLDSKILHVGDMHLLTTRYDAGNPALVISCSVQYTHCIKNEAGEIIEGGPKDIRQETQMWVLRQDESHETDDWYISEVSMMIDPVKIV